MQKASPTLWDAFNSARIWLVIGAMTVFFSSAMLLCAPVVLLAQPRRTFLHVLATLWGRSIVSCSPSWMLTVNGREHLKPNRPHILVSNHQSLLDIMTLLVINQDFKWVAKGSLFKIPFLGWGMALAGYIRLIRREADSIRETYDKAKRWLDSGVSVFFFPEGTRSPTGQLLPFKNGAFKLAMETGVPVVPIAISGTRDVLRRGSWLFHRTSHIRITILPPLDPTDYRTSGVSRLRDEARTQIANALHRHHAA